MAEALTPTPEPPEPPASPARSSHAPTFALLIGALAGIAIGAVALAVVLISGGREPSGTWSAWKPSESGLEAAQEIADHVAPQYRSEGGAQLVAVTGGKLELGSVPVHIAQRSESGSISIVEGSTALFTLCGGGSHCTIEVGKTSVDRLRLLRREALELALYAFHYLGVENVVTLLPPTLVVPAAAPAAGSAAGSAAAPPKRIKVRRKNTALLFNRSDLESSIDEPLRATLPADTPSVATVGETPEAGFVDFVTAHRQFVMSIVQGQDASAFLMLKPLP